VLEIRGLGKTFAATGTRVAAVDGIDADVAAGEFFVLLGPSGCGKTTMLRLIAGLERPDRGSISIDGERVVAAGERLFVRPERRPIAMVFQSYAVWPHMNVFENVAFPLREGVRRLAGAPLKDRVEEVLALLGLEAMADRSVTTLSGGQQQRVALARALALQPKVLLMDEPLSNLDLRLQTRLRGQLKALMHRLALTTIYVTHNQMEAMEMGDRIAVMDRGRIVQLGTPREVYRFPRDEFVARFIGEMALVAATLRGVRDGFALLDTALGPMRALPPPNGATQGADCLIGIRPEDVVVLADGVDGTEGNLLEAEITGSRFIGEATVHAARVGGSEIAFKTHNTVELSPGARVRLHAPPRHCVTIVPRGDADPDAEAVHAP
jgi:ABC-type Fe3+/spermidine/putrescine transport system ATPase subunit